MARHASSKFRAEMTKAPYELDLEDEGGNVVKFQDPRRMSLKNAIELSKSQDIGGQIAALLENTDDPTDTTQYDQFWAVWQDRPMADVELLLEDVNSYYGAGSGK